MRLWTIPALPLAGFLINAFLGRRLPRPLVGWVACGAAGLALLASLGAIRALLAWPPHLRAIVQQLYGPWIATAGFRADVAFLLDPLSAVMILVVTGVGFLIHVYSVGYMREDPDYPRYFAYLNLFLFFMLLLVLADNYLLLFVGWEGVGLSSYVLIGFWYMREAAARAATKAFVVNRIGDAGFLLGVFLIVTTFGTTDYLWVFDRAAALPEGGAIITLITLLLFLGATAKSAQMPLYVWLPDAMEGPTPVSALIHAATMVTAGVYIVVRSAPLFTLAPAVGTAVAWVGAVTALFAATIALAQYDMKRIIAYSTISQLGYMFLGAGLGASAAAMFHLTTQAFFKALLFLGAGSVMHALADETDIRRMGGLWRALPVTAWTFLIGALANAGIFPFAGFWSKDEVLWAALASGRIGLWLVGLATAFVTGLYTFRLFFTAFAGRSRTNPAIHPHESPPIMTGPLVVLAFFVATMGAIAIPPGEGLLHRFLEPVTGRHEAAPAEGGLGEVGAAALALAVGLVGVLLAYYAYVRDPALPGRLAGRFGAAHRILANRYWVDELYEAAVAAPVRSLAGLLWRRVDDGLVDRAVNGVGEILARGAYVLRRIQTGAVPHYVLWFFLGCVAILAYLAVVR